MAGEGLVSNLAKAIEISCELCFLSLRQPKVFVLVIKISIRTNCFDTFYDFVWFGIRQRGAAIQL